MVLQVGAVRHKLPPERHEDADALMDVERAGRSALAEMRRLLGALRDGDEDAELSPQPGVDRIEALVDEVGRAGLPVQLEVDGEPYLLPRVIDLSAYRIVQEGLTNALKHASASQARVTLRYRADEPRSTSGTTAEAVLPRTSTGAATACSASASGSRSTVAR